MIIKLFFRVNKEEIIDLFYSCYGNYSLLKCIWYVFKVILVFLFGVVNSVGE